MHDMEATMSDNAPVSWQERLAELLVRGVPPSTAIAECSADGVSQDQVAHTAAGIAANPLLKVAHGHWLCA
jgi:hypothetical protein